ncbi:MAG: rhodanese-like domain-containing protein [Nanoarchaeota archaeon]
MKTTLALLLTLSLLFIACQTTQTQIQTKYVCTDGSTVDQVSTCPKTTTVTYMNPEANTTTCPSTPDEKQFAVTATYLSEQLKADPKIVLIDVREGEEFQKSHLENAKNIPLGGLWKAHFFKHLPRDDPLVLYDNDGVRTAVAYRELARLGYKNMVKLAGGIGAWQQAGLLVVEKGQLQKGTPIF